MFKRCAIKACGQPHYARDYCRTHYRRLRKHGNPYAQRTAGRRQKYVGCQTLGCTGDHYALGQCKSCYLRQWRRRKPSMTTGVACRYCEQPVVARAMCSMHYQRWWRAWEQERERSEVVIIPPKRFKVVANV